MSKKILITGANGFLGSAITRKALEKKYKVKVLVRETSDISNLKDLNLEIFRGDLRRKDTIIQAFKDCQTFFHVAADYRLWARNTSEIYESNVLGTQNVIELIKDIPKHKLVYTSSVATLGIESLGESNESTPVKFEQMIGDYKKSKYLAENIVMDYIENKNLKCVLVNPSTPIGPRDIKPTPTGKIVLQMLRKKMPAYVETGLNFVHVDDVAEGHFQALEKGKNGEKYILGGENMSLKTFLDLIAEQANVPKTNIKVPSKPLYPLAFLNEFLAFFIKGYEPMLTINGLRMSEKKMFFSSEKAKKELGYRPRNVKNAIKDCIVWMNKQFKVN